ncbi:MAG: class I SAM-dependent methyltransferase [Solirubrobacterales bacterium]
MELYRDDLAYVHDAGFGGQAAAAAERLAAEMRARGADAGLVLDLGCGTGRTAAALVADGFDVHGVDQSAAAIRLARRNAPGATFEVGSVPGASLPACDGAVAVGEVLNYLGAHADAGSRSAFAATAKAVFAALRPGGIWLLDLAGPGRIPGGMEASHRVESDWAVLVDAVESSRPPCVTREIVTFVRSGRTYRARHETHRLALFRPAEVLTMLRAAGFRARSIVGYDGVRFRPGHTAYLAAKP